MERRNFVGSLSLGLLALFFPWAVPKRKTLKARWSAELAPNEAQMLMGYKGRAFLDTGYVYAPYRPVLITKFPSHI